MAGKVRYYIVDKIALGRLNGEKHHVIIIDRPTPWKVFLCGFLHPSFFGFVVMNDAELGRFLSNRYAAHYDGARIKINGDEVEVQDWSLLNVCKFCLEGFQYGTFLRLWLWRWR